MILQDSETSLADNTSVNEDDYVYEDDWEEEPEEKDSEEEGRGTDDVSQPIKNNPRLSGKPSSLPNEQAVSKMDGGHVSNLILEQNLYNSVFCCFYSLLQVNSLELCLI
jgi:hypothetical protein